MEQFSKVTMPANVPTRLTIDIKEAAGLIGISTACLYKMCREGQIPHVKIRAKLLFHREKLESWLRGELPEWNQGVGG